MIVFGPVPSRRLGQSLGINNIPPKICTYSCVYCQLGRTAKMQVKRKEFYRPEKLANDVEARIEILRGKEEPVDYLTFVPDGEPTLDVNMDREIELLKHVGVKVAVITNASLIWDADVRETLSKADWVSLKVDAVSEKDLAEDRQATPRFEAGDDIGRDGEALNRLQRHAHNRNDVDSGNKR